MSVDDILEQAKVLSREERQELAQRLMTLDQETWTDAELAALLTIEPLTGREIVAAGLTGGWHDLGIGDGAEWVNERKRQQRSRKREG